jgi:hypothetical protein
MRGKRNMTSITGVRYGRLTGVSLHAPEKGSTRGTFRCDCGTVKELNAVKVRVGQTKSCGCLRVEKAREIGKRSKGLVMPRTTLRNAADCEILAEARKRGLI